MRIVDRTTDNDHQDLAPRVGRECGVALAPPALEDVPPDVAAVLDHSDHRDPQRRRDDALLTNGVIVADPFGPEPDSRGIQVDLASFCSSLRSLALRAHRALTRATDGACGGAPPDLDGLTDELAHLQRQIDDLRQIHGLRLDEIQNWLERLGERIVGRPHP
jgi:hypothetical protein